MATAESAAGGAGDDDGILPAADLRAPDDARELERDRLAYLQELRERARGESPSRRDRRRRLLFTRRWERFGLSGPLVALVLLLVALVGSLAVVFTPKASPRPPAVPLAAPASAPGQVGGLLPDQPLELLPGRFLPAREVRPAVFALVPVGCDCPATIAHVLREAEQYRLRLWLVGAPAQRLELAELSRRSANGTAGVAVDPRGTFASYSARADEVTLVLVHPDGVVGAVLADVDEATLLAPRLAPLQRPGLSNR